MLCRYLIIHLSPLSARHSTSNKITVLVQRFIEFTMLSFFQHKLHSHAWFRSSLEESALHLLAHESHKWATVLCNMTPGIVWAVAVKTLNNGCHAVNLHFKLLSLLYLWRISGRATPLKIWPTLRNDAVRESDIVLSRV